MVSKGEMWVFDSSCIAQLRSQITTDSIAHNCIAHFTLKAYLLFRRHVAYFPKTRSLAINNTSDFPSDFETVGCYKDTRNRAIEPLEGKDSILDGSYRARKNPISKCAVAAMRIGYSMFGVQHGGWCVASATAPKTFDKYGKSTACGSDGEGGGWANQVYLTNC